MTCQAGRRKLAAGEPWSSHVQADHLRRCGACREFAERLAAARSALRDHHAEVRPDAHFSARVLERVRVESAADPLDELGWAALRLLPAALLLAATVSWTALQPRHGFETLLLPGASDDALVAFVASGIAESPLTDLESAP